MHPRHGFTVVELLVALLVASVGLGALVHLLSETARAAHRDGRRMQAYQLGYGLVAEYQSMPEAQIRRLFSGAVAQGNAIVWPPQPVLFEAQPAQAVSGAGRAPQFSWQWRWEESLPESGPLPVELRISSDWDQPAETVTLAALL